ncbi:MAG TPA: TPM domain-containing protein [Sphingobacteriaceae bacterium]|nr:TPM domain-containing protein [Sphingobacteriaceae bacterium]
MGVFNDHELQRIQKAVEAAEKFTSGEIRICVEQSCKIPVLDRAVAYFKELGMDKTVLKNGVLIYIAIKDHQFAIIGDAGINQVTPENFWDNTKDAMLREFKSGNMVEGIITGVELAGEQLKTFFPFQDGDINELPDTVIFRDGN